MDFDLDFICRLSGRSTVDHFEESRLATQRAEIDLDHYISGYKVGIDLGEVRRRGQAYCWSDGSRYGAGVDSEGDDITLSVMVAEEGTDVMIHTNILVGKADLVLTSPNGAKRTYPLEEYAAEARARLALSGLDADNYTVTLRRRGRPVT